MRADRPSATARLIAWSMVLLSREPQVARLVPPDAVAASLAFARASTPGAPLVQWSVGQRWFRNAVKKVEARSVPGMMLHYALRKLFLEETAREALAEGFRQVVVLGAGYDTLALRLSRTVAEARFFEIDHPATQAVKRRALTGMGSVPANLILEPVDLSVVALNDAMAGIPAFRADADTLFIAEGVLMYLDRDDVDRIAQFCRSHGGARARFAFTFMERLEDGRIAFRGQSEGVDSWLSRRSEPFRWGLPISDVGKYLQAQGFVAEAIATPEVLRERYLDTPELRALPLADGDHVCVAAAS